MGGRAFVQKHNIESKRISLDEYIKLTDNVKPILKKYFNKVHLIQGYLLKKDFGDADFLVVENTTQVTRLHKGVFGAELSISNSNITSYLINGFQVDVIHCNRNYFDSSVFYYDFDPLGNLMGKLYHKFRLCLGYDGLSYILRDNEDTYKVGTVHISTNPKKITEFLGLDYTQRIQGFQTQQDIFDYVISSKYFDARIFSYENMNHIARTRDKKRLSYQNFMSYIEPYNDKIYNWPLIEERLGFVDEYFPEANLFVELDKLKAKRKKAEEIAAKFNGTLVMEWLGIQGKELGGILGKYRNDFGSLIEKEAADTIKEHFLNWYKNFLTN